MKIRIIHSALIGLLVVVGLALPAWAQNLEGQPIQVILYEGLESLTEDTLNYYLGLARGGYLRRRQAERKGPRSMDTQSGGRHQDRNKSSRAVVCR